MTYREFFEKFFKTYDGKAIDVDGVAGIQCVDAWKELLRWLGDPYYYRALGGDGYAWMIFYLFHQNGYNQYFDIVDTPEYGDVLIYGKMPETSDSHVSFFLGSAGNGRHYSWGQNQGNFKGFTTITLPDNHIIAVLRPKASLFINNTGFSDVPENCYFSEPIRWAKDQGVITGTSEGVFRPFDPIKRADVCVILWRMSTDSQIHANPFVDVKDSDYFHDAVLWAKDEGITKDTGSYFWPLNSCTRGQAVTFLYRLAGEPAAKMDNPFEDVRENSYYFKPVQWAFKNKIVTGTAPNRFDPDKECSRADFITMLYRYMNRSKRDLYGIDISVHNGDVDLSGQDFVMIRAGYAQTKDPMFRQNVAKAEALGIPYGVYWYSYSLTPEQAQSEATACLLTIQGTNPSLGVWLDMEDADGYKTRNGMTISKNTITPICNVFCSQIQKAGYQPGIYASKSWLGFIPDTFDLWIADWGTDDGTIQSDYRGKAKIHQYTSKPLDKDVLYV